jgi:hypothetical protein
LPTPASPFQHHDGWACVESAAHRIVE